MENQESSSAPINIPFGIENRVLMSEPNEPVLIHKGNFILQNNGDKVDVLGEIYFNWIPSMSIKFKGTCSISFFDNISIVKQNYSPSIFIGDRLIGEVIITNEEKSSNKTETEITGVFKDAVTIGEINPEIDEIGFAIPNLKPFWGNAFQLNTEKGITRISGRISFSCKEFNIIIDQRKDYKTLRKKLFSSGGYILLYNGKIEFKKPVSYERTEEICLALNTFLSFINGRRVGSLFLEGKLNNEIVFNKYTRHVNESYQSSHSWALDDLKSEQIEKIWWKFWYLWTQKKAKEFLIFSIKWYCEGNSPELSSDTRLIMAQSTLELIFNWWLVELNGLIKGSDSRNLSASNKIRLILSSCMVTKDIPSELKELTDIMKGQAINDGPESIVYVRNALVHAHEKNRDKIRKIGPYARFQALRLAIMYIDLALLKILDYDGRYKNKCLGVQWVPWYSRNS
ncbi:hypothetical protein CSC80_10615 [Maribacter sp. 6B07]|uniref:hypothetical protein n=1 Tax=Maribacter sp. 6B07 TaxID=2045442 RepID=UPI000C0870AE|nr:hypothetical protein [Maribacter sp. 6B07]PHN93373.1 hypothetical protein CSC80_10615 [Maribacter sp. 6B07]